MTALEPKRRIRQSDPSDLEFDEDSYSYDEPDRSAMEALAIHLGSDRYFEGYTE